MALEHWYRGVARNGKIELEAGVTVPDGAEVIVLFGHDPEPKSAPLSLADSIRIIDSFKGRLPMLPKEAYSTDALFK